VESTDSGSGDNAADSAGVKAVDWGAGVEATVWGLGVASGVKSRLRGVDGTG
jgi:hypothetical protein